MNLKDKLKQIKEQESKTEINWANRRQLWIEHVNSLYDRIEEWLSEYQDEGFISFKHRKLSFNEQNIGQYDLDALDISIGKKVIVVEPVATLIIGAYGRLDMYVSGFKNNAKILFLLKNQKGVYGWGIADPKNRRNAKPFDKASLEEIIGDWIG